MDNMHPSVQRLCRAAEVHEDRLPEKDTELATLFGVSPQNFSNWKNRGITPKMAIEAEKRYGVSPLWVMEGIGDGPALLKNDDLYIQIKNRTASMGNGAFSDSVELVVDSLKVSKSWLRREVPNMTAYSNLQIIHTVGDSMAPTFESGDLLLVDTGFTQPISDLIYAFSLGDQLYVKRLFLNPIKKTLQVKSDNPQASNWDPLPLSELGEFIIHGRIVYAWKGRRL